MCDNGIGIKDSDQKKLFKLFGFLDSSQKVNVQGIGLGLYISKKITNKFGGDITVQSRLGIGSKFTFTFVLDDIESE